MLPAYLCLFLDGSMICSDYHWHVSGRHTIEATTGIRNVCQTEFTHTGVAIVSRKQPQRRVHRILTKLLHQFPQRFNWWQMMWPHLRGNTTILGGQSADSSILKQPSSTNPSQPITVAPSIILWSHPTWTSATQVEGVSEDLRLLARFWIANCPNVLRIYEVFVLSSLHLFIIWFWGHRLETSLQSCPQPRTW